jgi:hypothetical protein
MITQLELAITDDVSMCLVSPLALAVDCQAVRLSQVVRQERRIVIIRCTETFSHMVKKVYVLWKPTLQICFVAPVP